MLLLPRQAGDADSSADLDQDGGRTIITTLSNADGIIPGRMIRLGSGLPTAGSLLATLGSGSEFQTNNLSPGEGYSIEARTCLPAFLCLFLSVYDT